MKKAITNTGLTRGTPEGLTTRKIDNPKKTTNKKAPKAPKAEKPKRKQGGKGRPFREKLWADYSKGNKPLNEYTTDELRDITRRAAKAANSRLRALEKAELTGYAYKRAVTLTGKEKPRFKERTDKMTLQELRSEYAKLRDFMTSKTSTVTGYRETKRKTYENAIALGFTGDEETLSFMYNKYMTEELERQLGSDIIYEEITSGRASKGSLDDMIKQFQANTEREQSVGGDRTRGRLLLEALRKYGKRKRE